LENIPSLWKRFFDHLSMSTWGF